MLRQASPAVDTEKMFYIETNCAPTFVFGMMPSILALARVMRSPVERITDSPIGYGNVGARMGETTRDMLLHSLTRPGPKRCNSRSTLHAIEKIPTG